VKAYDYIVRSAGPSSCTPARRSAPTRGCAITSAARSTATTTRSAPAGWAQTTPPSWTPSSASSAGVGDSGS